MRKDAARNRERLIAVARDLCRSGAGDISLEEIATAAGVGRSTLFRNFADRLELIKAVQAVELQAIAEQRNQLADRPDALFELMRTVARLTAVYRAMDDSLLASPAGRAMMLDASRATARIFAGPIDRARGAGLIRPDVTPEDILIACNMIGYAHSSDFTRNDSVFERGFALVLKGIGSSPGAARDCQKPEVPAP